MNYAQVWKILKIKKIKLQRHESGAQAVGWRQSTLAIHLLHPPPGAVSESAIEL